MKKLQSHFWYTKSQRNGILFLILLILVSQLLYYVADFAPKKTQTSNVLQIRKELDSLYRHQKEEQTIRIYPFNPNFITDYKGYQLGMTVDEIDRLHIFRKKGSFVNSASEFKEVTQISDSLLNQISPYFKFPEWTQTRKEKTTLKNYYNPIKKKKEHSFTTNDINLAETKDFYALSSINESLANRIVKYRTKLQGYSFEDQLNEVWGIDEQQVKEVLKVFKIKSKPQIERVNLNTATFKEVLANPYVDYELCKKLFQYRDEVAELQSISEIKNVEGFPMDLYDRIVLYLWAK